jgi:F-type H+-transporting ATPase subunit delta
MSVIAGEIVEPYAKALMSVAQSNDLTEQFGTEIRSMLELMKNSPELVEFVVNPTISRENKKAVLSRILGEEINPYMRNFLMLLVDKGRLFCLEGIGKEYLAQLRKVNQTVLAEVTSAVELTEDQMSTVRDKVKAMTGAREVEIESTIDRDLLGGVIIKVGSQVLDASLRGQLRRIGISLNAK